MGQQVGQFQKAIELRHESIVSVRNREVVCNHTKESLNKGFKSFWSEITVKGQLTNDTGSSRWSADGEIEFDFETSFEVIFVNGDAINTRLGFGIIPNAEAVVHVTSWRRESATVESIFFFENVARTANTELFGSFKDQQLKQKVNG